jgi:hypothetical protein
MNATVAVCKTHESALDTIKALSLAGFPLSHVSLIAKVEVVEDHIRLKSLDPVKNAPVIIGSVAGPVLGLLSGLGVFAIPGFGFLYGAGAVIGTIAGFDLGLISGGILTLLATLGIKKQVVVNYEKKISDGHFLVIVQGKLNEIKEAEKIIHTEGKHLEWNPA